MNTEHLVGMANQIAAFFESYPDQAEAAGELAGHIQKFWAPRMRSQLLAHVDQSGGSGLRELGLAAILKHRALLEPQAMALKQAA